MTPLFRGAAVLLFLGEKRKRGRDGDGGGGGEEGRGEGKTAGDELFSFPLGCSSRSVGVIRI